VFCLCVGLIKSVPEFQMVLKSKKGVGSSNIPTAFSSLILNVSIYQQGVALVGRIRDSGDSSF
jgi:hypothetical protein